jgi:hypothetical protein
MEDSKIPGSESVLAGWPMRLPPTEVAALQRAASLLRLTALAIGNSTRQPIPDEIRVDASEALTVARELTEPVLLVLEQGGCGGIAALVRKRLTSCAESLETGTPYAATTDIGRAAWLIQLALVSPKRADP